MIPENPITLENLEPNLPKNYLRVLKKLKKVYDEVAELKALCEEEGLSLTTLYHFNGIDRSLHSIKAVAHFKWVKDKSLKGWEELLRCYDCKAINRCTKPNHPSAPAGAYYAPSIPQCYNCGASLK